MTNNPFLDHLDRHYDLEEISPRDLAALATAHELHEMNRLTAAANAPTRVVNNVQAPISPDTLRAQKVGALPGDGDARIAAAARRWAEAYAHRNDRGRTGAALGLAAAELAEVVWREDGR